ncbi:MAG: type II toxin-antitoxin system death-on-curing family toxin [Verrucomicrobia bacterium]|nr:type II toxin-antitoxin system death-on-curing family toxin [Verrucomicrobiota bacterium]
MKQPEWILRETVIALQEQLLAEFGGPLGIRDEGLLDSALGRPEHLFTYGQPTLAELAAAYVFGLVKNHPFLDGNKRIGFAIGVLFLLLNGRFLTASEADAVVQTLALAAGGISEAEYARWLEANSGAA